MKLIDLLWRDECGLILSAEAVVVATVAVVGVTVGLHQAATAVNEELADFAGALRSLDQSYSFNGFRGCGFWTAPSRFLQHDADVSVRQLRLTNNAPDKIDLLREPNVPPLVKPAKTSRPTLTPAFDDAQNASRQTPDWDEKAPAAKADSATGISRRKSSDVDESFPYRPRN
jgi:hypothetical protein